MLASETRIPTSEYLVSINDTYFYQQQFIFHSMTSAFQEIAHQDVERYSCFSSQLPIKPIHSRQEICTKDRWGFSIGQFSEILAWKLSFFRAAGVSPQILSLRPPFNKMLDTCVLFFSNDTPYNTRGAGRRDISHYVLRPPPFHPSLEPLYSLRQNLFPVVESELTSIIFLFSDVELHGEATQPGGDPDDALFKLLFCLFYHRMCEPRRVFSTFYVECRAPRSTFTFNKSPLGLSRYS